MTTRLLSLAILLLTSLSAAGQTVQLTDGASTTPWVAVGATRTAVVWQQGQSRIDAAILDALGNVVTAPFDVAAAPAYSPLRAAAVGDTFMVVWRDIDSSGSSLVRGAIVDRTGIVHQPFTIATTAASNGLSTVAVAGGTARFIVAWRDEFGSSAAWVNTAGVVESMFPLESNATVNSLIVRADGALAVWSQTGTERLNIGLTVVVGSTRQRSVVIASMPAQGGFGTPYLYEPSIDFNGNEYFVAWIAGRTGRDDIAEGTRLASDLSPLDVDPSKADGHHAGATAIAADWYTLKHTMRVSAAGPRFLVSWIQANPVLDRLKGRYVEADGQASTTVSFPLAFSTSAPNDTVASGTMTVLPNGAPIAAWTLSSGKLFTRTVGGGSRARAARR